MDIDAVAASAQEHLRTTAVDGWLLYDYRGMNPIFWDTVGAIDNVTRPCWLWIPAEGDLELLVSYVDQGRFGHLGIPTKLFVSRADMLARLGGDARWSEPRRDGVLAGRRAAEGLQGGRRHVGAGARSGGRGRLLRRHGPVRHTALE